MEIKGKTLLVPELFLSVLLDLDGIDAHIYSKSASLVL